MAQNVLFCCLSDFECFPRNGGGENCIAQLHKMDFLTKWEARRNNEAFLGDPLRHQDCVWCPEGCGYETRFWHGENSYETLCDAKYLLRKKGKDYDRCYRGNRAF